MNLIDLIPDADVLCALEPEELGLRMLPVLANWPPHVYLELGTIIQGSVNKSGSPTRSHYPSERGGDVEQAIREAWAWLDGSALLIEHSGFVSPHLIRRLSRRACQLAAEPDARKVFAVRRIPKETLHPAIREDVWSLYLRGKYDQAVLVAMKAVEVAVREAAGFTNADYGTDMIARAFNENNGPLRDPAAQPSERSALRNLFVGAHGSYKNPHSHRNVPLDDPDEAAEIIMLANHLLRIVDSRRPAGGTP